MRAVVIIAIFLPALALSQISKEEAQQHLVNLKEGALFVRLPTSQNKIKALLEAGQEKKASKVARQQQLDNIKTYMAFKAAYNYSPVYFFYNLSSDAIKKGEFKGHLLNEQLEPDPSIDYTGLYYYIAEFDVIQTTGLTALVVKDRNFDFLQKPFPYYSRKYHMLPIAKKSMIDVVKGLNSSLQKGLKE